MGNSASPVSATRPADLELRKRPRRHAAWWLLSLLTVLGLAAIIASAWLAHLTPHKDKWLNALWLEVAKADVQVVAVGVLGGALAAIWQNIRARRDREIERNDKIRAEGVEARDGPTTSARRPASGTGKFEGGEPVNRDSSQSLPNRIGLSQRQTNP
jgi:hypothetical protein